MTVTAGPRRPVGTHEPAVTTEPAGPARRRGAHPAGAERRLEQVPRPGPDATVVDLGGLPAGGLTARQAEWRVDGGEVLLTGAAPFTDLTGRAGFRSDGTLDGTVAMHAQVRLLGLPVATAQWSVGGWSPDVPLPTPHVRLQGSTLVIDLTAVGSEVTLNAAAGLAAEQHETGATITLPQGALPEGLPLEPRVVELFRGLHGWDVSDLRVHPDAAVEQAPAFVSDRDLFFAPGRYGLAGPETVALLDAAVRAALAGALGPIRPTPPAPPAQPAADTERPPPAETTPVPAVVPPAPAVEPSGAGSDVGPEATTGATGAGLGDVPVESEAVVDGGAEPGTGTEASDADLGGDSAEVEVELLMPAAPDAPGPAAQARMGGVGRGAGGAARAARDLPPAEATVDAARGAVTEPVAETAARAREDLAAALGERPGPSPEIVALCERIRTAIREHRPVDEDELLSTDPTREAQAAGATVAGSVEGQVQEVEGGYDALDTPPAGAPALAPTPVETPSPTSPGMGVDATGAAPDPIPAEDLSLDADVTATDQRIADAGIDTRVTREIPDGPFASVREGRGELGEMAQQTPGELAAEQAAAIETAQADMAALQQQATAALLASRASTVGEVGAGQHGTVGSEEQTRESVGASAQLIFDTARTQVDTLLTPLTRTAMARWTTGLAQVSQEFQDSLDRVQRWIDDRHSGVDGWVVGLGDAIFGLPDWVIREYDRAERAFGDGVCELLLAISTEVNSVVAAAQAVITQARDDIDDVFTAMEAEFPEWAAQERARFGGMLDGLSARVTEAQTSFVRDVSQAATTAVAEAQAAVEERREAARGVVGRIVAAIEAFIDDPVTAIINGLLTLVGIPPAAFWALVAKIQQVAADIAADPETFINNLVAGLAQGFSQFFDNFGTHLLQGFWNWLFSELDSPVPMPADLSAGSLFSFALQLMGITWPRVREILVAHVGEQNVEIVEAAWELISVLIAQGPQGLVDMVKERLAPEVIVQAILEAAIEYLVETLVAQVAIRILGMLNPVGAVAQAIELIYQVCAWVFRNAARIFRFVETVVNGMADVIAGNITGLANAVERSLASLLPVVIDFLAGLMHLGGLPEEVAGVIESLQARVYAVMDLVIGTIAERGRALLQSLGLGGEEDEAEADNDDDELGTTVRFTADGESHRLFFQVNGADSTLMVASVPAPIENRIADWRAKVAAGEPQDDALRAEASTRLVNLETIADEASAEGDRLAALFLEASADPDVQPPSDDALENRQRAIAGILDRLFTIFGQEDEAAFIDDMNDHLPGHGQTRASTITDLWATRYSGPPEYVPAQATAPTKVWQPATLAAAAAPAAIAVLQRPETPLALLPYFTSGTERRGGAAAGAFRDYALVTASAPHGVREQFENALGDAYAREMASRPPQDVDPVDTQLRETISAITYQSTTAPYGGFSNLPGAADQPDPPLVAAAGGDFIEFLRAIARTRQANGYTAVRLQWAWTHAPSKTWLNARFRVRGEHEWIPTNLLPELLLTAFNAAGDTALLARAVQWIDFQHALRSQTRHVLWHFTPEPAAHVGSFSSDESGRHSLGTAQSKAFHDWLRTLYATNRDAGPYTFSIAVMTDIEEWVWNGRLTGIPAANLEDPITAWYNLEGVGRVQGLSIADLGAVQGGNYLQIIRDFEQALSAVNGW